MHLRYAAAFVALVVALPGSALAKGIPSIKNLKYKPKPAIDAIPPTPDPAAVKKFDPTGNYNAYDINVFETIWFPTRQPGDTDAKAEPGGAVAHGTCPSRTGCENHELEFQNFWLKEFSKLVKPFGGAVHRYPFHSSGSNVPPFLFAQPAGDSANLMAVIPGSKHPEQQVVVSGHYDQTTSGPASAWDSAEGHATVFRIAKLMTDYWKKTGTRPPVTVKFAAWGAEEAGSNGSEAYIRDNLFPFPKVHVNGYFNLDPCAGAYPAHYRGNPVKRVPMVLQLSNPDNPQDGLRTPPIVKDIKAFNKIAMRVKGDVMNHLDDKLTDVPGEPEIFVSKEEGKKKGIDHQEDELVTALGGLAIFSSDYANFDEIGVPVFNLFADMFGPHADGSCDNCQTDGIQTIHTPRDNLLTLNALTGVDQSGLTPSQGWYKGLEFCAHMHSWFMLQRGIAGSERRTKKPVAYFEGHVREAVPLGAGGAVSFDSGGSYAFANPKTGKLVPSSKLKFRWKLGDGTKSKARKFTHAYKKGGVYDVSLKVTAPGGRAGVMKTLVRIG
ncbi:MAG: M28 family peptidase [Actinomycetota bacterium]|nr:M28 family peptidase [Actinomycetota bacterium]